MISRSERREVRNPVLSLPAARHLQRMPRETRLEVANLLFDLASDAARRSETAWHRHKGPMAVYWKAVSVYSRHIARVLRAWP